ncbi:MAG: cell division protein FtsQ/DivIB [Lachnospiraceae bacterium]|nr:cell division protein FtsQ/DivIB [Lachnospiraceae bacterium]
MENTKTVNSAEIKPEYSDDGRGLATVKWILVFLIAFASCCCLVLVIKLKFTITQVSVTGNSHYSVKEVEEMVMSSDIERNSIFLYLRNRFGKSEPIPFVEEMEVEIVSPTSVRITVYEKALAGYVEYLGHYLYFDKDGIVVESSTEKVEEIPFVTGLQFEHMALHEKLPVEDEGIFKLILSLTQLLNKYNIRVDRIYFDNNKNITLYFDKVGVILGTEENIDEKINKLQFLLPKLKGYSGELHMENYSGVEDKFSFERK